MHLLKWEYQKVLRGKSWKDSIADQREKLKEHLEDNPSLKSQLNEFLTTAYKSACKKARVETGLSEDTFPLQCLYTIDEYLNNDFFPQ